MDHPRPARLTKELSDTFHRYPVELIDVIELRNGQRVTIRPVLPQDVDVTQAFVRALSVASRVARFLGGLSELSATVLERLTRIDYRSHLALVAEVFPDGIETVIAEARYAIESEGGCAELAIAVADEWQGIGLGTFLWRRLRAHAEVMGISRIVAVSLASNQPAMEFMRKEGFSCVCGSEFPGLFRYQLELTHRNWTVDCRGLEPSASVT